MPDDPEIGWLWMIASVAETYHVMPPVVARELMDDPEHLSIECLRLTRYAEAYHAYKRSKKADDLKPWKGSKMMEAVTANAHRLHNDRVRAAREAREAKQAAPQATTLAPGMGTPAPSPVASTGNVGPPKGLP